MSTGISFTVLGKAIGKGRPRFSTASGFAKAITPEKTANYENLVKLEYSRQCGDFQFPQTSALEMTLSISVLPPKGTSRKKYSAMLGGDYMPCKKPDVDNIAKIICDALNTVAYADDTQICVLHITKLYGDRDFVHISINEIGLKG